MEKIAIIMLLLYNIWSATIFKNKITNINSVLKAQNTINAELRAGIDLNRMKKAVKVTVTAYSPREQETDSTPYEAAFMRRVDNRTIALSWDLLKSGWNPNTCLYLDHPNTVYRGLYKINDGMNKRYKKRADVFLHNTNEAIGFGALDNIDMIYLGDCP